MQTISVAISSDDYDAFKRAAKSQGRPVAQLIREAMAHYRTELLEAKTPLTDLPVLPGHRPTGDFPSRETVWDEVFDRNEE